MSEQWLCGRFEFSLERPILMGIVNVTPDSFSDGGQHASAEAAIAHAWQLRGEGAHILDIGGESTRPGAQAVSVQEELARVLPVVEALRDSDVAISVDTCKPEVMHAALAAGADMINDVTGFRHEQARLVVSRHPTCGICVMHMQGEPKTMQQAPRYDDVVDDIRAFFDERLRFAANEGIREEQIWLDPGFGFGKTVDQNLLLLRRFQEFHSFGRPLLLGVSNKSTLGAVLDADVNDRTEGTAAAVAFAAARGVHCVRVHDVRTMTRVVRMCDAITRGRARNDG